MHMHNRCTKESHIIQIWFKYSAQIQVIKGSLKILNFSNFFVIMASLEDNAKLTYKYPKVNARLSRVVAQLGGFSLEGKR